LIEITLQEEVYIVPCVIALPEIFLKTVSPAGKRGKRCIKKEKPMTKKVYLDDEERRIIEAYKGGEFVPAPNTKSLKGIMRKAATNYLKKDARINIRLSEADLRQLKLKAAEEGMPYQTLIASVLHKFASGRL
jgi:hypothetical protein